MLRSITARLSTTACRPFSRTFKTPIRPYLPRLYSTQPPPSQEKKQLYTYEKEGPSIDFKDDFVGDRDQANQVPSQGAPDKWAGVEPVGFRKKYLHEVVSKDIESLRNHLNSITDRVMAKQIGDTKEDRIMLRKLASLLDRTELEMQSHQAVWRKAAKPKRKIPWAVVILFSTLVLILIVEYERYLDHLGPPSAFDVVIPYRYGSQLWGKIARTEIPTFLRRPIYTLYASIFGVNLSEMGLPLDAYPSLGDFFARPLKQGARTWTSEGMASPVDGVVVSFGPLHRDTIEQVKGLTYTISDFLSPTSPIAQAAADPHRQFYQTTIYLAPGDYHRVHAPTDYVLETRRIVPGRLVSVSSRMVATVRNLFAANERVVLEGRWAHGLFAEVLVGAYNVGSIVLPFDDTAITNTREHEKNRATPYYEKSYKTDPLLFERGSEVGQFHMGSTVVLIFEAPIDQPFEFTLEPGRRVTLGQKIGDFKSNIVQNTQGANVLVI